VSLGIGMFRRARLTNYSRSPIDFHDNNQVTGNAVLRKKTAFSSNSPISGPSRCRRAIRCYITPSVQPPWTCRSSPLTGLVDADSYVDNFINFPGAIGRDAAFNGVLPKGTPVRPMRAGQGATAGRHAFGRIEGRPLVGPACRKLSRARSGGERAFYRRRFSRRPKR